MNYCIVYALIGLLITICALAKFPNYNPPFIEFVICVCLFPIMVPFWTIVGLLKYIK